MSEVTWLREGLEMFEDFCTGEEEVGELNYLTAILSEAELDKLDDSIDIDAIRERSYNLLEVLRERHDKIDWRKEEEE